MSTIAAVIGRILIGLLFIVAGIMKIADPGPVAGMIAAKGMSANLVYPVAIFEIVAGLCLAIGLMTRLAAILLVAFTAFVTLVYHNQFATPEQIGALLNHFALIGGLLLVFAHSQMWWSYDAIRRTRKGEIAARDAEARAHDADLRAARAEGAAAVLAPETVAPPKRSWF